MIQSLTTYLAIVALLSLLITLIGTHKLLRFCKNRGIYDTPNERKVHHNNIPRLGGIFFAPIALVMAFLCVVADYSGWIDASYSTGAVFLMILGAALLHRVGLRDDLHGVSATHKFLLQIAVSLIPPINGLYTHTLYGFLGIGEMPFLVGAGFTVFVSLLIINAFNLIDGIDGLSGSLSLIAFGVMDAMFIAKGSMFEAVLCTSLIGCIIGFLRYNLFGNAEKGTKIFMGDTGSLTLGFFISYLAFTLISDNNATIFHENSYEPLLIPFTLVIIPCFDLVRVTVMRIVHHKPVFGADKTHLHHKYLRAGFSMTQALILILILDAAFCAMNAVMMNAKLNTNIVIFSDIALFTFVNLWLNARISKKEATK